MATFPKMAPCPKCQSAEHLAVYRYESGWRYVECDECFYLVPGEGSTRQAIKSHNARMAFAPPTPESGGTKSDGPDRTTTVGGEE